MSREVADRDQQPPQGAQGQDRGKGGQQPQQGAQGQDRGVEEGAEKQEQQVVSQCLVSCAVPSCSNYEL